MMNKYARILMCGLALISMLACSVPFIGGSVPVVVVTPPTNQQVPGGSGSVARNAADAVSRVTINFLTAVQSVQAAPTVEPYLGDSLKQRLTSGQTYLQLLNVQSNFSGFDISPVILNQDATQANLNVTLNYPLPVVRRFTLTLESANWKIQTITPIQVGDIYPSTPEGVVESFLIAYQGSPDQMKQYLSSGLITHLPASGAAGLLGFKGTLQGYVIQSGSGMLNPPGAIVKVALQVGGQVLNRNFTLLQDNGKWVIDTIQSASK
ncbi:MAG: hypothetical protein P4L50_17145 [Anaerolineaceae bacterium]|nr:hypothetical protein [Anaerolineaceae bacterium]